MISREEVIHIAKLARLELTDQEIEKMQKDLSGILDYFDMLKNIKTEKFQMKDTVKNNVLREDASLPENNNTAGDLVEAAPDKKDGYIKVKQVL